MAPGCFRFGPFLLDADDRRLTRDGAPVELNARYLDALALLVRERGKLVSKDRFLDEVWRGVPVTDEALTQCIRTIRRQLGDDAANPRFIETVKWRGVPVWEHAGIPCTGEVYKACVKLTFARGASLPDPSALFNASLEGNARRAIDIGEGAALDETAFKALIRAAVALNTTKRPRG